MCDADCAQCIYNTCVCPPGYGGWGEGVNLNDCHLNQTVIEKLWYAAFAAPMLPISVLLFLLARWMTGGGEIDWRKLITNRNFLILCSGASINIIGLFIAGFRVFGISYVFNDYGATVLFATFQLATFLQSDPLTSLYSDTLVGLLTAIGVKEDKLPTRAPWQRVVLLAFCLLPHFPLIASPALDWHGRKIMVQYHLLSCVVIVIGVVSLLARLGERAIRLLTAIGTPATVQPRKRTRWLLIHLYTTAVVFMAGQGTITGFQRFFPYFLPCLVIGVAIATLGPPLVISYDKSKIRLDPSTIFATRSSRFNALVSETRPQGSDNRPVRNEATTKSNGMCPPPSMEPMAGPPSMEPTTGASMEPILMGSIEPNNRGLGPSPSMESILVEPMEPNHPGHGQSPSMDLISVGAIEPDHAVPVPSSSDLISGGAMEPNHAGHCSPPSMGSIEPEHGSVEMMEPVKKESGLEKNEPEKI